MQTEARLPAASLRAAARPEFTEILDRVRKMRPEIASRALASEKAKRVSAETMEALRDADVFRVMQPKRFGGYEYGPAELAQIGFELVGLVAAPDGAERSRFASAGAHGQLPEILKPPSTGSTLGSARKKGMTAFFPLQAQQEVWRNLGQFTRRLIATSEFPGAASGAIVVTPAISLSLLLRGCISVGRSCDTWNVRLASASSFAGAQASDHSAGQRKQHAKQQE